MTKPDPAGQISDLRPLLNVDDDTWVLVIVFLLYCLYPGHPQPILVIIGEQGTGKTFAALLLKILIDPGKAPLIPAVADLRNLAIQAQNRLVLAYDNLSYLSTDQSDALCRISTGGGFSVREHYENDQEMVFEFIRPQIITGIGDIASRSDLLERSVMIKLSPIPEEERKLEADLNTQIKQLQGRILGALLTALSQTLKALPTTNVDRLPRMADFARFAIAAEPALGLPPGSFLRVYRGNRQEAQETVLESSPVATAIQRFMAFRVAWKGNPTELLAELESFMDEKTVKSKAWAGNPNSLGRALARLAPALRGVGIHVESDRKSKKRFYRIERVANATSFPSSPSQGAQDQGLGDDSALSPDVIEGRESVIHDASHLTWGEVSQVEDDTVTTERAIYRDSQPLNDNGDTNDGNDQLLSSWVGKTVKKQGKQGWIGVVKTIEGNLAEVLWQGDPIPTTVMLSQLEAIA